MSDRIRNDKGRFSLAAESAGDPSVQETPEQRERNNLTLVTEQFQREFNSLASPRSIGTADDIASKTEAAPKVLARLEQSEIYIFMKCIPQIISDAHARELIKKFPLDLRSDLGLVTEDDLRCDPPAGLWETGLRS